MQAIQFQSLVREDATCLETAKPAHQQLLSSRAEARAAQEKPVYRHWSTLAPATALAEKTQRSQKFKKYIFFPESTLLRITYLYHIFCNYFCLVFLFFFLRIFHDKIVRRVLTRIRKKVFRMTLFPPAVTMIGVILSPEGLGQDSELKS